MGLIHFEGGKGHGMSHHATSPSSAPSSDASPVTFSSVFDQEVKQIKDARVARKVRVGNGEEFVKTSLIGLAFSGGGIRSATFNLGFLQAMARERLLHNFDYLSTVSGGGYIGSWLAAVTSRFLKAQSDKTFEDVETALKPEEYTPKLRRERSFLHWLRMYSSYLTPNTGMTSGDTWAMIGTWLRNAFLNQAILGLLFLGIFALLESLLLLLAESQKYALVLLILGAILMFLAAVSMAVDVADQVVSRDPRRPTVFRRTKVTRRVMLPYLAACILLNTALWRWKELAGSTPLLWLVAGAWFYVFVWGLVAVPVALRQRQREKADPSFTPEVSVTALLIFSPIAGAIGGGLLYAYWRLLAGPRSCTTVPGCDPINWMVVVFGPSVVILCLLMVGSLHLGLTGRGCRDLVREWWARLGGYMMLITLGWLGAAGICAFGPLLVRWCVFKMQAWSLGAALLWILHTYFGVKAANSPRTSGSPSEDTNEQNAEKKNDQALISRILQSPKLLDAVARAAPYVFAVGLLLLLATVVHIGAGAYFDPTDTAMLWHSSQGWSACCGSALASVNQGSDWGVLCNLYWGIQNHGDWQLLLIVACSLMAASVALSWRVDVNDFSLHHFYRNRLVRCYLGASNSERKPQAFTRFDPGDDLDLKDFSEGYPGPYPIINAALNITTGEELGYATRRAKSFFFSPKYCGYEVNAPRNGASWFQRNNMGEETFEKTYSLTADGRTERSLARVKTSGGISLGTAMAISGAAASPNMGYYTSAATGLFMTLFDVRLGWWMGNSRYEDKWRSAGPALGLGYLFSELTAQSDQKRSYVYLSDGGHFENLAVYELIRRHCKVIVACDVDADPDYRFENLLGLIEKARTDFGADIVLNFEQIRPPKGSRQSRANFMEGDIYYDPQNQADTGKFIYVKASMPKRGKKRATFEENVLPDDVWLYFDKHKSFPHQSTADQWFDELQFESYRALGEFIGRSAVDKIRKSIEDALK